MSYVYGGSGAERLVSDLTTVRRGVGLAIKDLTGEGLPLECRLVLTFTRIQRSLLCCDCGWQRQEEDTSGGQKPEPLLVPVVLLVAPSSPSLFVLILNFSYVTSSTALLELECWDKDIVGSDGSFVLCDGLK